ncbi:hypothetical protein [Rhodococcus aetherivorans]|uniref:hypothetical protein n=1 Tax=Rhodococcus aetherivorans TaxID=191292 RepID=UPI001639FDA9|nr:hypothetical protein [Rhodococcus aetherivorans]MBC2592332.1 hypothetical protein [Rhodococcus aetherivorans]
MTVLVGDGILCIGDTIRRSELTAGARPMSTGTAGRREWLRGSWMGVDVTVAVFSRGAGKVTIDP